MTAPVPSIALTAARSPSAAQSLVIAHASAASEAARVAINTLDLPHLATLLGAMAPLATGHTLGDDEYSLSATHEHVLAAELGWSGDAGHWPFAARLAQADGLSMAGELPWGLITPCHWLVSSDKISMVDPEALQLDEAESRALFEALRPSFEAEGWQLHWGAPLRWYARHAVLGELRTASLDRVIGRNLDLWLRGGDPSARRLRRLQVEAQMLWHEHPVNEAREARRDLAVNSFWLSACGRVQPAMSPAESSALLSSAPLAAPSAPASTFDESLRAPMLADDWTAWCAAWQALDAGPIAALLARTRAGEPTRLTLCGERVARRYEPATRTLWQRVSARLGGRHATDVRGVLHAL